MSKKCGAGAPARETPARMCGAGISARESCAFLLTPSEGETCVL